MDTQPDRDKGHDEPDEPDEPDAETKQRVEESGDDAVDDEPDLPLDPPPVSRS